MTITCTKVGINSKTYTKILDANPQRVNAVVIPLMTANTTPYGTNGAYKIKPDPTETVVRGPLSFNGDNHNGALFALAYNNQCDSVYVIEES